MRNSARFATVLFPIAIILGGCSSSSTDDGGRAEREAEFERLMRNATLQGYFTVTGREDDARLRPERYEVESASKIAGDLWTINARIQYGDHDVTVPVPVRLSWAGDTPVVQLTDAAIPGLGTFTARVLFYRDHYSGMWWHGETGGNQFGIILREADSNSGPDR